MSKNRRIGSAGDSKGLTLPELIVSMLIFAVIGLGLGSLYLSSTRAMDEGSSMVFLQRQGTQIQEELARHIQRATVLEVDSYGATQSRCHPTSGVNLDRGKSIIYQRAVTTSPSQINPGTDEFWCVYEYQGPGDSSPQLWRCRVSGLTAPQICSTTPENLIIAALRGFRGLAVGVSGTCFRPQGLDLSVYPYSSCVPALAPASLPCCPPNVDVAFALDVRRDAANPATSLVGGARQFVFNLALRN